MAARAAPAWLEPRSTRGSQMKRKPYVGLYTGIDKEEASLGCRPRDRLWRGEPFKITSLFAARMVGLVDGGP